MERSTREALDELGNALNALGASLGKLVIWLSLSTCLGLFRAWILVKIWAWFLAPAFGLPPLRVLVAWGIVAFFAALRLKGATKNESKDISKADALWMFSTTAFGLLLVLGTAWIVSFFL